MERTEALRRDPNNLVPWAVSLVSVAMNYFAPLVRPEGSAPGHSVARNRAPREPPREKTSDDPKGWISRYAWGDDYHDVMLEKLRLLLEAIRDFYPGHSREGPLWTTGPVLERDFAAAAGIGWTGKNTHLISPRKGSWFFLGGPF